MTHTAEPMSLEQVRDGIRAMGTFPHSVFSKWADAIDAELAKQREAEPIYVYEYDSYLGVHREFNPITWNGMRPTRTIALYTYPQQRKAVDNDMRTAIGRDLDAIAGERLRDREDAEDAAYLSAIREITTLKDMVIK